MLHQSVSPRAKGSTSHSSVWYRERERERKRERISLTQKVLENCQYPVHVECKKKLNHEPQA